MTILLGLQIIMSKVSESVVCMREQTHAVTAYVVVDFLSSKVCPVEKSKGCGVESDQQVT